MFNVNASLSDATVVALAKYFAAHPVVEPASSRLQAEKSQHLFRYGQGSEVAACQGCHGTHGEGGGSVPRLGGQRPAYLRSQLEEFSMSTRVHETMNVHARNLTEDQIDDLVAFLSRD